MAAVIGKAEHFGFLGGSLSDIFVVVFGALHIPPFWSGTCIFILSVCRTKQARCFVGNSSLDEYRGG